MSSGQTGFFSGNGCKTNCYVLNEALRAERAGRQRGVVETQADLAKAIDTVPHNAIYNLLQGEGVPKSIIAIIRAMYSNATTELSLGENRRVVPIKRGVKQGDPLSPLLFNCVLDPLLRKLNGSGVNLQGTTGAIAFADDLTLFLVSPITAQEQLRSTESSVK